MSLGLIRKTNQCRRQYPQQLTKLIFKMFTLPYRVETCQIE